MTCIPVRNKTYEGLKGNKLPGEISGVMSAAIVLLHTLTDATVVLKPVQMFRFSKKCCLVRPGDGPSRSGGVGEKFHLLQIPWKPFSWWKVRSPWVQDRFGAKEYSKTQLKVECYRKCVGRRPYKMEGKQLTGCGTEVSLGPELRRWYPDESLGWYFLSVTLQQTIKWESRHFATEKASVSERMHFLI